jgi:serine/threonine-protein kinase
LQQLDRRQTIDPLPFATAYLGVGDKEKALEWLGKAYLQHSPSLIAIKVEPVYDPLRGDPRFQEILRRINLAE